MRVRVFTSLVAVVGLGLAVSGCGSDTQTLTSAPVASDNTPATRPGAMFGATKSVGGASIDLNAVTASRPVVFWFWAPG